MTNKYESTARTYLKDFQNAVKVARNGGAMSVEMATRPVVHNFVQDLVRLTEPTPLRVNVHHDTTVTPGNRPDWWIEDSQTFGVYVYGDHKNLDELKPFQMTANERSQMERYLSLGRTVFVFDGIEFIFLDPNDQDPFLNS